MIKKIVEKWKNRETKKSLREENLKLQGEIDALTNIPKPSIHIMERNEIKQLRVAMIVDYRDPRGEEDVKQEIAYRMSKELHPFIEWDFGDPNPNGRELSGSIYLAVNK